MNATAVFPDALVEEVCREVLTLRGGDPDEVIQMPQQSHIVGVQGYHEVRVWQTLIPEVLDALTMQHAIMRVASRNQPTVN